MSGGHWNGNDQLIGEQVNPKDIPVILKYLPKIFREVDLAICNDKSKEEIAPEVFKLLLELGDKLFLPLE
jgi:hypothetical protein